MLWFAYFLVSSITGLKVFRWHYLESWVEAIYDSACSSSFDHLIDVVIFGSIWIPYSWKIIDTIEPRFVDTRLLHLPNTETSFLRTVLFSLGKAHPCSLNLTRLMRTLVNVVNELDNRCLFLAQSTDSHRKSTLLMRTLHYQLYVITNLSFLKVKKNLHFMFQALQFTGYDDLWIVNFKVFGIKRVMQRTHGFD